MKVYAEHEKIQSFLRSQAINGVEIVDSKQEANYLITGRYNDADYHQNLFGVIIPWTGHNGINLDDMRDKKLRLFVTPTRSKYVAEKAVTLTLALLGNTVQYHELLKEGHWGGRNTDKRLPWTSIQGLSVGLFGFGRIGKIVYKMLKGFDVSFYTINRKKDYPNDVNLVKNITNLIQVSDIIIISTPLNSETEELFNDDLFAIMKNKYLINVGRGKIVKESSLYHALQEGIIKGYASDVWYQYPQGKEVSLPSSFPIHEFNNVLLSNHSGGFTTNTNEEVNRELLNILENIVNEKFDDQLDLDKLI